jgi:glycosyltransferase involved in cell wall biosynthesis
MQDPAQKPIDVVMWTLNGEKTLRKTLASIDQTIPKKCMNQKIIIDGGSTDKTVEICEKFGWKVIPAKKRGIPYQANQALDEVETEFYASFEQDIQLTPLWHSKVIAHFKNPQVAVAQGMRFCVNPILKNIEKYGINENSKYMSLDNTIYRTAIMKKMRYNEQFLFAVDRDLQQRIEKQNYKWVIDRTVVSEHLKESIREYARKTRRDVRICRYVQNDVGFNQLVKMFLFSPLRGLAIAMKMQCPHAFFVYPYLRLQWISNGKF